MHQVWLLRRLGEPCLMEMSKNFPLALEKSETVTICRQRGQTLKHLISDGLILPASGPHPWRTHHVPWGMCSWLVLMVVCAKTSVPLREAICFDLDLKHRSSCRGLSKRAHEVQATSCYHAMLILSMLYGSLGVLQCLMNCLICWTGLLEWLHVNGKSFKPSLDFLPRPWKKNWLWLSQNS